MSAVTLNMKQESTLSGHLQQIHLLKKELHLRKEDVETELKRLHRLYDRTLTRIDGHRTHRQNPSTDSEAGSEEDDPGKCWEDDDEDNDSRMVPGKQEKSTTDNGNDCDILKRITIIFDNARIRLNNVGSFLDAKMEDLTSLKRQFRHEHQLAEDGQDMMKRHGNNALQDASSEGGDHHPYEMENEQNSALVGMFEQLKSLQDEVVQRLDEEFGRCELEEFLSQHQMLDIDGSEDRKELRTKLVLSPRKLATARLSKSTDSVSKECLLSKTKILQARKAHALSDSSLFLVKSKKRGVRKYYSREHLFDIRYSTKNITDFDDSLVEAWKAKNMKSSAEAASEKNGCLEHKTKVIQVPEVTSSVQDGLKTSADQGGDCLTDTSLTTSCSTTSVTLGDSSLQMSSDSSEKDVSEAKEDGTESMTTPTAVDTSSSGGHTSREEISAKRKEALSRPRSSKGGSRYIQIGLPEQRQTTSEEPGELQNCNGNSSGSSSGSGDGGVNHFHPYTTSKSSYRGSRPSHRSAPGHRLAPGLYNHRTNRRSQSSYSSYRHPWYPLNRGYFPSQYGSTRRAQSSLPVYRGYYPGMGRTSGYRYNGSGVQRSAGLHSRLRSGSRPLLGAAWQERHMMQNQPVRKILSSVGSRVSSFSSSSSHGDSEDRSDVGHRLKDSPEHSPEESELQEEHFVTIKLVTADTIQKHRGPGLVDRLTQQADSFMYPKRKTLEDLNKFVLKRLGVYKRGLVRLWLFEDEDGLFLPRRPLMGGDMATDKVGSLQRGTVTLYVQTTDLADRLYTIDHNKIRFVFVKAPHWNTGEFVTKGHHEVDITKATRAVIQVLKKKFMPLCSSPVRLYIETGGKQMKCVSHTAESSLSKDTEGRSRHGDILILLEEFIDEQITIPEDVKVHRQEAKTAATTETTVVAADNGNQLVPLSPFHGVSVRKATTTTTTTIGPSRLAINGTDHQHHYQHPTTTTNGSPSSSAQPVSEEQSAEKKLKGANRALLAEGSTDGGAAHGSDPKETDVCCTETGLEPAPAPCKATTMTTSTMGATNNNFIIPCDYTTSASDESLSSPASGQHGDDIQHSDHHRQHHHNHQQKSQQEPHVVQWDLTNNYLSRFNNDAQQNGEVVVMKNEEPAQKENCLLQTEVKSVLATITEVSSSDLDSQSSVNASSLSYSNINNSTRHQNSAEYDHVDVPCGKPAVFTTTATFTKETTSYDSLGDGLEEKAVREPADGSSSPKTVNSETAVVPAADFQGSNEAVASEGGSTLSGQKNTLVSGNPRMDVVSDSIPYNANDRCNSKPRDIPVAFPYDGDVDSSYRDQSQDMAAQYVGAEGKRDACDPVREHLDGGDQNRSLFSKVVGPLNPVAAEFTPGKELALNRHPASRTSLQFGQMHIGDSSVPARDPKRPCEVKLDMANMDCLPRTPPNSNAVAFRSEEGEEPSVYYTPRPTFVFPDTASSRLQSTAVADMNASEDYEASRLANLQCQSQLNPEQISAITNRSSSFMAIRLPHQAVPADQLSAIPNISSSFMEIPSQAQIHNTSFPSASFFSTRPQPSNSQANRRRSPFSPQNASLCQPLTPFDTSHLRANGAITSPRCNGQYAHKRVAKDIRTEKPIQQDSAEGNYKILSNRTSKPLELMPVDVALQKRRDAITSEASGVKRDDPAIMDIGQKVIKSSLNANATEFIPKEPARLLEGRRGDTGMNSMKRPLSMPELVVTDKLTAYATRNKQYHQYAAHPPQPASQLTHPFTSGPQQLPGMRPVHQQPLVSNRVSSSKRPSHSVRPVNGIKRFTDDELYCALKHGVVVPPAPEAAPKLPIMISLTDGTSSHNNFLSKERVHGSSRHVTFADQLNSRNGPGTSGRPMESGSNGYGGHQQKQFSSRRGQGQYEGSVQQQLRSNNGGDGRRQVQAETIPIRRKIGSGRFDDRPKRYSGELRRPQPVLREMPAELYRKSATDPYGRDRDRDHRGPRLSPASSGNHGYYTGPAPSENGGDHRYGHPQNGYREKRSRIGDNVPAERQGLPHHHHMQQQQQCEPRTHRHPYIVSNNGYPNNRRSRQHGDGGWFGQDTAAYPPAPPLNSNSYRQSRSFRPSPNSWEDNPYPNNGRRQHRGGVLNGARRGPDSQSWRQPSRYDNYNNNYNHHNHNGHNTSSDQSNLSANYPSGTRRNFSGTRRISRYSNRPINDPEMENSVGSATSNTTSPINTSPDAAAAEDCESGQDSSDSKTTQSSSSSGSGSKQALRIRRGYIQIGLGKNGNNSNSSSIMSQPVAAGGHS